MALNIIFTNEDSDVQQSLTTGTFYVTIGEEAAAVSEEISLVLDTEKNNEQTTFAIGADAFVKVLPTGDNNDIFAVNIGSVQKVATNIPWVIENEDVRFVYTDTCSLTHVPSGAISYAWIGRDGGNPKFDGKNITLSAATVGVLRCTYTTYFDRLRVTYSGVNDEDVLLVAIRGVNTASLILDFNADGVTGAKKDVIITVKNYCNDEVVPYANVTLWGRDQQRVAKVANDGGQVTFEDLTVGESYNIVITASDYRTSTDDSLDNASFTVS